VADRTLAQTIAVKLKAGYSPAGTAHLLGGIATETIYAGVYAGTLGVKAHDVLRSRRHRRCRRDQRRPQTASHFLGVFTSIHDRPAGYRAESTAERLDRWVADMPHGVLRSLTWDRGSEMAHWQDLAIGWGVDVYFADAHSPWQRGQNENGNRQLRFWLPKGTDLRVHAQADLDGICHVLNTQPRKSLAWKSPNDVYADHAAG
jgi:IS30 family transposase